MVAADVDKLGTAAIKAAVQSATVHLLYFEVGWGVAGGGGIEAANVRECSISDGFAQGGRMYVMHDTLSDSQ